MKKIIIILLVFGIYQTAWSYTDQDICERSTIWSKSTNVTFTMSLAERIRPQSREKFVSYVFDSYRYYKDQENSKNEVFIQLLTDVENKWKHNDILMSIPGEVELTLESDAKDANPVRNIYQYPFTFYALPSEIADQDEQSFKDKFVEATEVKEIYTGDEEVATIENDEIEVESDLNVQYQSMIRIPANYGPFFMMFQFEMDEKHECNCAFSNINTNNPKMNLLTCFYKNKFKESRYFKKKTERSETKIQF
ncbi:MAG: hypothetical protein KDD46_00515 [Bdellovibrionales bacterium]|nr:hypothetical protein [Bdellovibrionales bacterium]